MNKYFRKVQIYSRQIWRKVTKRQKILVGIVVLVLLFLILPNINAGLKVLGFAEKDFIQSNSGAIFETNPKSFPYFRALIGVNNSPESKIVIEKDGRTFNITFVENVKETPLEIKDQDSTVPQEILDIEEESQKISKELELLSAKVDDIQSDVVEILGDKNQSYFGPFEQVKFRGGKYASSISYHREKSELVETWEITDLSQNVLNFVFDSKDFQLKIFENQNMQILQNKKPFMDIFLELEDSKGQKIVPPNVQEVIKDQETKSQFEITFPEDVSTKNYMYPLKLIRRYKLVTDDKLDNNYLSNLNLNYLSNKAHVSYPEPKFLTIIDSENYLFWDKKSGEVVLNHFGNITPLFNNPELAGISCNKLLCVAATTSSLLQFNPQVMVGLDASSRQESIKQLSIEDTPVGGVSLSDNSFIRTANYNPGGKVYLSTSLEGSSEIVSDNLSFPNLPEISSDDSTHAFFANGKVYFWNLGKYDEFYLPSVPIDLALDNQNRLYFIIPFWNNGINILGRVTPGLGLELASGLTTNFTSVDVDNTRILIGANFTNELGAVVDTDIEDINWVAWNNYEQN